MRSKGQHSHRTALGFCLTLFMYLHPPLALQYLPVPAFNIINGGSHAGNALCMQEFMIMPTG